MDNIMGRVETKERMRLWDREREKASENFVLWKFSWNSEWQLMMSRVGHACARRSDSLWNPEKLLEENWSKGKKGMESCQSNWPWHGTRQLRLITVRYTTANDYVSNPISASKALRISTTSAISTAREEEKGPTNNPTQKRRPTPPPFFVFPVFSFN